MPSPPPPLALGDPILQHVRFDFIRLHDYQTVGEALATLRSREVGEKIVYFYVVDERDRLVGVVPTRRLLMNQPEVRLTALMVTGVKTIPSTATVLEACELFMEHRYLALPVVDEDNHLLGTVDVGLFTEEVASLAEQRSADRAFQIIGVHVALGRRISAWMGFKDRFPWLLCNIGGGLLCAVLAGMFEGLIDAVVILALFIPVVLALGESVSIQSMALTLQSLQQERLDLRALLCNLRHEFITSIMLGTGSGLCVALVALIWKRQPGVSIAIFMSILLAMVTACLLGVLVPTLVRAFRGDPRIAAGPIVLASADTATILFYFSIAGWLLTP